MKDPKWSAMWTKMGEITDYGNFPVIGKDKDSQAIVTFLLEYLSLCLRMGNYDNLI